MTWTVDRRVTLVDCTAVSRLRQLLLLLRLRVAVTVMTLVIRYSSIAHSIHSLTGRRHCWPAGPIDEKIRSAASRRCCRFNLVISSPRQPGSAPTLLRSYDSFPLLLEWLGLGRPKLIAAGWIDFSTATSCGETNWNAMDKSIHRQLCGRHE